MAYRRKGGSVRASTFDEFGSATAEMSPSSPCERSKNPLPTATPRPPPSMASPPSRLLNESPIAVQRLRIGSEGSSPRFKRGWFKKIRTEAANID